MESWRMAVGQHHFLSLEPATASLHLHFPSCRQYQHFAYSKQTQGMPGPHTRIDSHVNQTQSKWKREGFIFPIASTIWSYVNSRHVFHCYFPSSIRLLELQGKIMDTKSSAHEFIWYQDAKQWVPRISPTHRTEMMNTEDHQTIRDRDTDPGHLFSYLLP